MGLLLNQSEVNKAREVVQNKIIEWNKVFPNIKFDKDGRAIIAEIPNLTTYSVNELIRRGNTQKSFLNSFNTYLKENQYEYNINNDFNDDVFAGYIDSKWDISPESYVNNVCRVKNKHGKIVTMKFSKLLAGVQSIWEKENPIYSKIMARIKELRASGESFETCRELVLLDRDKKYLENGNLYSIYQKVLNEYTGNSSLWLSINPLDLLTSSGEQDEVNPTKFESCWSIEMSNYGVDEHEGSQIYTKRCGCYSHPQNMVLLGSIANRGMIFTTNGRKLEIGNDGFYLNGYKERSHVWFDEDGLFIERMYPCKSETRKYDIEKSIEGCGIKIIKVDENDEDFQEFKYNDEKGIENYLNGVNSNDYHIFLDRVAIDESRSSLRYLTTERLNYDYDDYPVDFIPSDDYDNRDRFYCEHCDCRVYDEDPIRTHDGRLICQDCYDSNYFTCDECGEVHYDHNMININGSSLCENCVSDIGFLCEDCDNWKLKDDIYYATDSYNDEISVCSNCISNYSVCEGCGKFFDSSLLDEHGHCEDCRDEEDSVSA